MPGLMQYTAGGDVAASVADVTLLERQLTPAALQAHRSAVQAASLVMLDANLSPGTLQVLAATVQRVCELPVHRNFCMHVAV